MSLEQAITENTRALGKHCATLDIALGASEGVFHMLESMKAALELNNALLKEQIELQKALLSRSGSSEKDNKPVSEEVKALEKQLVKGALDKQKAAQEPKKEAKKAPEKAPEPVETNQEEGPEDTESLMSTPAETEIVDAAPAQEPEKEPISAAEVITKYKTWVSSVELRDDEGNSLPGSQQSPEYVKRVIFMKALNAQLGLGAFGQLIDAPQDVVDEANAIFEDMQKGIDFRESAKAAA